MWGTFENQMSNCFGSWSTEVRASIMMLEDNINAWFRRRSRFMAVEVLPICHFIMAIDGCFLRENLLAVCPLYPGYTGHSLSGGHLALRLGLHRIMASFSIDYVDILSPVHSNEPGFVSGD